MSGTIVNNNEARLTQYVSIEPTGCWEWSGARDKHGYGQSSLNGKHMTAYRAVWLVFVGEVPAGLDLDHLCNNRACVNPDHLEPVDRRTNLRRAVERRTPPDHGTRARYKRGCRCAGCLRANADYEHARWLKKRGVAS